MPLARTQHIAISIPPNNDRIFIYGGHHNPQARLNDTWFLNVKDFEWVRVGADKASLNNGESSIGAPPPRANAGACLHENKIYVFGGHGGLSYQRIAFNDLHAFDLETETWEKIVPVNSPPEGRGGHSCFANNNKIYVYGGWNTEMQYDNITLFDLDKKEWFEPDIFNPIPRWNHSSILVPAIPTQKFFIFGGECAEYNEGSARKFGQYVNSSCYLDLGILHWVTFASDPEVELCLPSPREYAAMTYSKRERILLVHGGWNNGW
jgi:dynein heavy chain